MGSEFSGKVEALLSDFGYIQAHIFTSDANIPLAGASVSFVQELPAGGRKLLAFRRTDASGNTERIRVETPGASDSQSPGMPVGFTDLTIEADTPGFERVTVRNAQVFPGITTRQDIQMLPTEALPAEWGIAQQYSGSPQDL